MFKRYRSKDIPRCAFPWRTRPRKPSVRDEEHQASDFIANNFEFLDFKRAVSPPWKVSETDYADLARAAGLTSSFPSPTASYQRPSSGSYQTCATIYISESSPPPLPDKPLQYVPRAPTCGVNVRQAPEEPASKHVPSHSTTSSMNSTSSLYTDNGPAASPATTPSIGSSFMHRRAGSSATKPPPPPLKLNGPPRKGSLPSLYDWQSESFANPALLANLSERSASLPMNSLETMRTKQVEILRLPLQGISRHRRAAYLPETYAREEVQPPESTVEQDAATQPQIRISGADSKEPTRSQEISDYHRKDERLSTQTESSGDASHPWSAELAARTSSRLSTSHKPSTIEPINYSAQNRSPQQAVEVTLCLSSSSTSGDHGEIPTSARPSKSDSVGHTSLLSPRYSLPSQESHIAITSGNTDKSFDLSKVPFNFSQASPIPMSQTSHAPRTPVEALLPSSPSKRASNRSRAGRRHSIRSRSSRSITSSRRSLNLIHFQAPIASPTMAKPVHKASSLVLLMRDEPFQRPFPWKPVKVADAKKKLTAKQLHQLVLESMRGYATMQQPAFVLEGLDQLPSELQFCKQRIQELELAYKSDLEGRQAVLKRHIACLQVLNGDQGVRFGESLVSAVSRSDRCAQEICKLWEHVLKLESLQDGHWRAAASLSLAKLNSYLKAKAEISSQCAEIQRLKAERDQAAATDMALVKLRSIRDSRGQSLTVPASLCENSGDPTPSICAFDLAAFPTPPITGRLKQISNDTADLPIGSPCVRHPPTFAKSLPPSPPPTELRSKPVPPTEDAPSTPSKAFCPMPTPSLSPKELTSASLVDPPGSKSASKLKIFTDRILIASRSGCTAPTESELPWARPRPTSSVFMGRTGKSQSKAADIGLSVLDPCADLFSSEIETLKCIPPTMHLSGPWDAETAPMRSSLDSGQLPSRRAVQTKQQPRATAMSSSETESRISSMLEELRTEDSQFQAPTMICITNLHTAFTDFVEMACDSV